jgi:DNA-binding response OmpR family regulator
MKPPKRVVEEPAPASLPRKPSMPRFGDLELDRHAVAVRGPRGSVELSLGEFRVCALPVEAAGETVPLAELVAVCGVDSRIGRNALQLATSRLRSHLCRRGSTVTVAATRGVGWRLLAAGGSHARGGEPDGTPES